MGKPYIDFGKIREQISLLDVLGLIGHTFLVKTKWRCYGRCPLHCCAASRAASFYLPKNLWFCHRCKQGGNQLDLYSRVRNMNEYDAALDLCAVMNLKPPLLVRPQPLTEKDIREYRKGGEA